MEEGLNTKTNKTVFQTIYDWSLKRPLWQRDALRRIIQNISLNEKDLLELVGIIKHGYSENKKAKQLAAPLSKEHIPNHQNSEDCIFLAEISNVLDVNNLALDQTIKFAEKGITVIYGDNGSGKSGYTRILKNACRARHRSKILPNIYDKKNGVNPRAKIGYIQNSSSKNELEWKTGENPHPILSAISVFDRECGTVHVSKKNKVAYRPYGLDVPDTLAEICKKIEEKLKEELKKLEQVQNKIFASSAAPWQSGSVVGKAISSIKTSSKKDDFEKLSKLNESEEQRLIQLNETLSKDISKAAKEQKSKSDNLRVLADYMLSIEGSISDDKIELIRKLNNDSISAKTAAELLAKETFSESQLNGVGAGTWKALWESARKYAESTAYPEAKFPNYDNSDLCVLCHQTLSDTALKRLKKFEEFVKGDAEKTAQEKQNILRAETNAIPKKIHISKYKAALDELKINHQSVYKQVYRFFASARLRVFTLGKFIQEPAYKITTLTNGEIEKIREIEASHLKLCMELEEVANSQTIDSLKKEQIPEF